MSKRSSGYLKVRSRGYERACQRLNLENSRLVANNSDSPAGTIDLHGLYVKEGKWPSRHSCT
jgi:hypothetical protein